MSGKLSDYVKKNNPDSKSDLFAVFIERCGQMTIKNGYQAMITQHAWMFLSSFERFRDRIQNITTVTLIHLGIGTFEDLNSKVVQSVAFVKSNNRISNYLGSYDRLFEKQGLFERNTEKQDWLIKGKHRFYIRKEAFNSIPGRPVAYWISEELLKAFSNYKKVGDYSEPRAGIMTGDESRFCRYWTEVSNINTSFVVNSYFSLLNHPEIKWVPITHGGSYRKWFGNADFVVNMKNGGEEIANQTGNFRLREKEHYFKRGITWTKITSSHHSFRVINDGTIFGDAGPTCFMEVNLYELLSLLNSKVGDYITEMINPTINTVVSDIAAIPVHPTIIGNEGIVRLSEENVKLANIDWDCFECSWEFKRHPLV